MRHFLYDRMRRGFSSIEVITIIAVMGAMMAIAGRMGGELSRMSAASSLANFLNIAAASAKSYLEDKRLELAPLIGDSGHIYATKDGVFDAGGAKLDAPGLAAWLPAKFGRTRFGQDVRFYIYKGHDGMPRGLLATHGGIPDRKNGANTAQKRYLSVARKVVGMNGFGISVSKTPAGSRTEPAFVGESGSWRFPFNDPEYGAIPDSDFPDGQLARPVQVFAQKPSDNVLYRVDAGDLNSMKTDIDMGGNDIRHVHEMESEGVVAAPLDKGKPAREISENICVNHPDGFIFTMSDPGGELDGLWFCMGKTARLVSDFINSRTLRASLTAGSGDVIAKPFCPPVTRAKISVHPTEFFAEDKGHEWLIVKTGKSVESNAHVQIFCEKDD